MKVTTKEIRGLKIDIEVDGQGAFSAMIDGCYYVAPTLAALTIKLEHATKQQTAKLAIDFWRWDNGTVRHGVITGIHVGNGNIMTRLDGEKPQQESAYRSAYHSGARYLKLTETEQKEYGDLMAESEALKKHIDKFEKAHGFVAKNAVINSRRLMASLLRTPSRKS